MASSKSQVFSFSVKLTVDERTQRCTGITVEKDESTASATVSGTLGDNTVRLFIKPDSNYEGEMKVEGKAYRLQITSLQFGAARPVLEGDIIG